MAPQPTTATFGPTLLGAEGAGAAAAAAAVATAELKGEVARPAAPAAPCFASRWAEAAQKYGHGDAIIFDGIGPELRFTFRDLEADANRLARNLLNLGVGAGDRLVTIAENRPEMVVLLLSCLKLGTTFVPLATDLRVQDCRAMVAMYEPKLVVCDQAQYAPFALPGGRACQSILLPRFREGDNALKRMMAEGSDTPIDPPTVSPEQPCIVFSTSGSTGLPKGVMYSWGDVASFATSVPPQITDEQDRHLMWVSMRGIVGSFMLLQRLLQGSLSVMVDTYPAGPELWGHLIDKHQVNSNILFGAAMNQMLQDMPNRTFNSVKNITYGGSCFAPALIQRSMEQFPNAAFTQGYGMTEVFPMARLGPESHKRAGEASPDDLARMASAGKVFAGADLFIEDSDRPGSGQAPPAEKNGVGQICARSTVTMIGYYGNPEKTKEVMPDSKYVRTGDIGRIDEDGFLYILGRMKDIIPAYKGFNVAPRDIEEVLYAHPGVGQAAVVGAWHPSGAGEAVVAWVSAKAGAQLSSDDLKMHCEKSGMPSWQMPDAVHVVDRALPTVGGKMDYKALRATSFRQAALAMALVLARAAEARASADDLSWNSPARAAEDDALVAQLSMAAGGGGGLTGGADAEKAIDAAALRVVFGDALPSALQALCAADSGSVESVQEGDFRQLLGSMRDAEHEAFVLGATSLLRNWASDKLS